MAAKIAEVEAAGAAGAGARGYNSFTYWINNLPDTWVQGLKM